MLLIVACLFAKYESRTTVMFEAPTSMVLRTDCESITINCQTPDKSVPVKGTLLIVERQAPAPFTILHDTPSVLFPSTRQKSRTVSSLPSNTTAFPVAFEKMILLRLLSAEISD